jgi:hypothetical protein
MQVIPARGLTTDDGRRQVAGGSGQCSVDRELVLSGQWQWTVTRAAFVIRHSSFVVWHWLIG